MGSLTKELIKKFVAVTNDSKNAPKDATQYGTIVKNGENYYVKLDGSDGITPIDNIISDIDNNDRVSCIIKDHKVIVTGNLTDHARSNTNVEKDINDAASKLQIDGNAAILAFNDNVNNKTSEFTASAERLTASFNDNAAQKTSNFTQTADGFVTSCKNYSNSASSSASSAASSASDASYYSQQAGQIEMRVEGMVDDLDGNASINSSYVKIDKYGVNVSGNRFQVSSTNFSVTESGLMEANNCKLTGNINIDGIGYLGKTSVGGNENGIGIRNYSENGAILIGPYSGNVWLGAGSNSLVLSNSYNAFVPWNNAINLGQSSRPFNEIFANSGPWSSTSDLRLKNVRGILKHVRDFYKSLKPIEFAFKPGTTSDDGEKTHYGLIAQEVNESYEKIFKSNGHAITKKVKVYDKDTQKILGDEYKYVIDYNELHAFHIAMIQDLMKRVEGLEKEVKELKERS